MGNVESFSMNIKEENNKTNSRNFYYKLSNEDDNFE